MLVLERMSGERIMIGDDIVVTILAHGNRFVKIGIDAPTDIPVHREEVYDRIRAQKVDEMLREEMDKEVVL